MFAQKLQMSFDVAHYIFNTPCASRRAKIDNIPEWSRQRISKLLPPLLTTQHSSWEQGSAAQAILETHLCPVVTMAIPHAVHYLYGLAHDAVVRQGRDGRLSVLLNGDGQSDLGALDPGCIGESFYLLLSFPNGVKVKLSSEVSSRLEISIENMLIYILEKCPRVPILDGQNPTSADTLLSHRIDSAQIWSDSVYMLPPFLASASVYYSQRQSSKFQSLPLLHMSLQRIISASEALQSPTGEWSHIYDMEKHELTRKAYWGVGNGWVCGGIVRVFRIIASAVDDAQAGEELQPTLATDTGIRAQVRRCYSILVKTLDACLGHIRWDGLFHNILDDADSFVETNLSQQLAYTLYRLLDLHQYTSAVVRNFLQLPTLDGTQVRAWEELAGTMHQAAVMKTDEWGFVRGVCGSPRFDSAGTAAEGQAWGILMEVARAEYLTHKSA
ncbi:hypothetical protein NM688_g3535 [Phlebia brevispora]|uniref:Uncharacterized protein n=1 Tax=Phlebia brevispora TaxID=194682 RepID=A0ACC1T5N8_9APHY|nr:hypothetical protein NM688_g3535 [Phlebia brevispora]